MVAARRGNNLMPELGYKPVNKYLPPRSARMASGQFGAANAVVPSDPASPTDLLLRWVDRLLSR